MVKENMDCLLYIASLDRERTAQQESVTVNYAIECTMCFLWKKGGIVNVASDRSYNTPMYSLVVKAGQMEDEVCVN